MRTSSSFELAIPLRDDVLLREGRIYTGYDTIILLSEAAGDRQFLRYIRYNKVTSWDSFRVVVGTTIYEIVDNGDRVLNFAQQYPTRNVYQSYQNWRYMIAADARERANEKYFDMSFPNYKLNYNVPCIYSRLHRLPRGQLQPGADSL